MEVRARSKDIDKFRRIRTPRNDVQFTADESVGTPVVMDGLTEYLRGYTTVRDFLKLGWHRIRKGCPYRHRRCTGERCSLYFVENGTGDCVMIWNLFFRRENG